MDLDISDGLSRLSIADRGDAESTAESAIAAFRAVSNKDLIDVTDEGRKKKRRRTTPSPSPSPEPSESGESESLASSEYSDDYSEESSQSSRRSGRRNRGMFSQRMSTVRDMMPPPAQHHAQQPPLPTFQHAAAAPPQPTSMQYSPYNMMSEDPTEKQLLLLQLNELARQGTQLSRTFTMNDDIGHIRTELNFHKDTQSMESWVSMVTMGLCVGAVMLQQANDRLGPFLSLEGLSTEMPQKLEPLKPCIRKIYQQNYSSFQLSPVKQLLLGLATIVFGVHAQNKWGKGAALTGIMEKVTGIVASAPTTAPPPKAQPAAAAAAAAPEAPTDPLESVGDPAPAAAAPSGSTRVPLKPPSVMSQPTSAIIE